MTVTTSRVCVAFNAEVARSRAWLKAHLSRSFGYSTEVLADRITQRVAELGLAPYAVCVHESSDASSAAPNVGTRVACGGISIDTGSGRLTTHPRQLLSGTVQFLVFWFYGLVSIVAGAFVREGVAAGTLVFDVPDESLFTAEGDRRFVAYCKDGPIVPLRNGSRLFVESTRAAESSVPDVFRYDRHPLIALVRRARLGILERAVLLLRHLVLPLEYVAGVSRAPILSSVSRELAWTRIAFGLDKRSAIEAIVLTCAACGRQPLWARELRNAKVHMIWYSQNARAMAYVTDEAPADWPSMLWMRVDEHWVWTNSFANYLTELGQRQDQVHVVGPILFYQRQPAEASHTGIKILVFDVPAVADNTMLRIVGEVSNYYHPEKITSFLRDVLALREYLERSLGRPVSVLLKRKRGMRPHYAPEYFQYIDRLAGEGHVDAVPDDANLYSLVSDSDLVVAYPFTSPAYLAEALGVPCIYYDSTATARRDDFSDSERGVRFARGLGQLSEIATELLVTGGTPSSICSPAI